MQGHLSLGWRCPLDSMTPGLGLQNTLAVQEEVGEPGQADANEGDHDQGDRYVDNIAKSLHGYR
jgi:hypothetical protein